MPNTLDSHDHRSLPHILRDAVVEHEREHGVDVDEAAVLRYVDIALTEIVVIGGVVLNPWQVDALRRSLTYTQQVVAATAGPSERYLETLGLLSIIGDNDDVQAVQDAEALRAADERGDHFAGAAGGDQPGLPDQHR